MENGQGFGNNGNVRAGQRIGHPVIVGNTVNIVNIGNGGQPGLIRS